MTTSTKIEPANWQTNVEELTRITSPESVIICMPSRIGKTLQENIAKTLKEQKN